MLDLPNPPTAIFAANDESAIGTIEAAREDGLQIPDDLSVVGFDNMPGTIDITPALTTVEQPMTEMGYAATEILIDLMEGKSLDNRIHVMPTKLTIRDSCRAIT